MIKNSLLPGLNYIDITMEWGYSFPQKNRKTYKMPKPDKSIDLGDISVATAIEVETRLHGLLLKRTHSPDEDAKTASLIKYYCAFPDHLRSAVKIAFMVAGKTWVDLDKEMTDLLAVFIMEKKHSLVVALLETRVNPNSTTANGRSILALAASCESCAESVEALLKAGAEPDFIGTDPTSWTPLTFAASEGNIENTKALLKGGANPNFINANSKTPLTAALEFLNDHTIGCIKVLLEHGANPDLMDGEGNIPMDMTMPVDIRRLFIKARRGLAAQNSSMPPLPAPTMI